MHKILIAALVVLGISGLAQAEEKKATPQQQKMAACNKEAGEKKLAGDERKKFMSECLKAKPAAEAKAAGPKPAAEPKVVAEAKPAAEPKSTLGACSKAAAAKGLKGDERNKYLSACNKAGGPDKVK
ncbi:MAG: PsiF repeat protein [Betaproteobacteria bacterium]|nr:PsiF repeat protein [Betaproteobacteria bacterium]